MESPVRSPSDLGAVLRELRAEAGLTQQRVAARLFVEKGSQQLLSRYELGAIAPRFQILVDLLALYGHELVIRKAP